MKTEKLHSIKGVIVDPVQRRVKGSEIFINEGKIISIENRSEVKSPFILPGFIDSHVHIESSMLIPSQFARMAVKHGTVAVITDPHEVANVAGVEGIQFMIENSKSVPMYFFFGLPSCVPASPLEKSGAILNADIIEKLINKKEFTHLAEMMNFPGVIYRDMDVEKKINSAKKYGKPIDGHAPGLSGEDLKKYVNAGITTDHECSSIEEAIEKIELGMKILIREGSAARNFETLIPLIKKYPKSIMFCTDDCHPDYIEKGHINKIVSRAVLMGYDLFDVIHAAAINPIIHYKLPMGGIYVNNSADFVVVNNLEQFDVIETYINGVTVYSNGEVNIKPKESNKPGFPFRKLYKREQLNITCNGETLNVIGAIDGELITKWLKEKSPVSIGEVIYTDPLNDFLKIVLLDRYSEDPPIAGFIRGFGLKKGAIAASVAHDSHHIISIGCDDQNINEAIEWIVAKRGGICFSNEGVTDGIPLPFYGLMANKNGEDISRDYINLNYRIKELGCSMSSPFMTLSFMALTVIPELKIYHEGLFDATTFKKVNLFS